MLLILGPELGPILDPEETRKLRVEIVQNHNCNCNSKSNFHLGDNDVVSDSDNTHKDSNNCAPISSKLSWRDKFNLSKHTWCKHASLKTSPDNSSSPHDNHNSVR